MSTQTGWSRDQIARRIAADIPDGAYVNLGIGMPTKVADVLPPEREVVLHSENGILGMGAAPPVDQQDPDLINAGKEFVTLLPGGSYFHHTDSFMIMRGGHLDVSVLGAFEVAMNGDLANWSTGDMSRLPGVGGAMDLAVGAKKVLVAMTHTDPKGRSKLVARCQYPLTAMSVVDRVYTDLGVFAVAGEGFDVVELAPGVDLTYASERTAAPLHG
ncbi:3-oxoacid CoA-transferase subunit B [Blastococcus sp. Marseille-P5729]|uniref:3-oxoacid CoA-transferase subunit B n=1 Tax=Blastococcus sp. Marseille-P5729 TaxID=2086582 RepID=UPI000D0F7B66|nr:3-oxoacid CoA-transferase subunit B [Blastococcus sp. Marseille-P5729]